MVQEKQLKELFKYIQSNWGVYVTQIDKTDIKRIFGGVLTEDIMNDTLVSPTEPSSQAILDNSSMTYYDAVDHILKNKLTHKQAGNDSWFAYYYCAKEFTFCDESGKDMIRVRFDELDLNEWYHHKKPFDRERFEAMFRALIAGGIILDYEIIEKKTKSFLKQLDAYYAEKEKGGNEK